MNRRFNGIRYSSSSSSLLFINIFLDDNFKNCTYFRFTSSYSSEVNGYTFTLQLTNHLYSLYVTQNNSFVLFSIVLNVMLNYLGD